MSYWLAAGSALVAYLIGSISFARMAARRVIPDQDLDSTTLELPGGTELEYGGISATSLGARAGPKWGVAVGLADMAKAFLPTLAARLIWPDDPYHLIVAVAAIAGHNYPIYHRLKGGRGQSPLYGGLLAIDWLALPITTVISLAVGLYIARDMFVGYTLGQKLLIPWFIWRGGAPEVVYALAANLLYDIAAIPEIKQYIAMRRSGELHQLTSWRELRSAHPAMGTGRHEENTEADIDDG